MKAVKLEQCLCLVFPFVKSKLFTESINFFLTTSSYSVTVDEKDIKK